MNADYWDVRRIRLSSKISVHHVYFCLNIGCNHQLVFNSHSFTLMPPYIYISTNVFTIKSEQKNKNQRKCSFCLCFWIYSVFRVKKNIGMSLTLYNIVFCALSVNSEKKSSIYTGKISLFWCCWFCQWKCTPRL